MENADGIVVSIIIPCFNAQKTIENTLDSVHAQVFHRFEVILVNDGSTDNTQAIIRRWLKSCSILYQYYSTDNQGVSLARNLGLSKANGKYIVFLDADDVYHPYYLYELVNAMENAELDTAYCNYTNHMDGLRTEFTGRQKLNRMPIRYIMKQYLYQRRRMGLWSFIYKKEIIQQANLKFVPDTRYGEDGEFLWKYIANCQNGAEIRRDLYGYNLHTASATRIISVDRLQSLKAMQRVEQYYMEKNHPYHNKIQRHAYNRTLLSVIKTFARHDAIDLYTSLAYAEKTRIRIFHLLSYPDIRIVMSALLFCLNPKWFFYMMANQANLKI